MRMPPVLLWGRSPSAIVPQGVSWWICVGILVLLEPSAPPVPVSPWRRAPLGCLVPGCLGPLKTLAVSWRRAPQGCLVPAVVRSWRRAVPSECLLPGRQGPSKAVRLWHRASGLPLLERRVPLKALVAPWGRAPLVRLPPGRLVPWRAAVRPCRGAPQACLAPRRRVPLKVLVSPWWQSPPDCLAPGLLGGLQGAGG